MKERVSIIAESGIEILFIDFSGLSGDEFIAAIEEVKNFRLQLPISKYYPSITDMSNARANDKVRVALKDMEQELKKVRRENPSPKIKIVIGIKGLQKVAARAIMKDITFLNTKEEAIDHIRRVVS